ncbi:hypothetical protein D3C84_270970 [compost metagenome]
MPLDVEEFAVGAEPPPLQQIEPPGIVRAADGHVIGHEVQHQAHVPGAQGLHQAPQCGLTAQFGIDPAGVDHIVSVRRAAARTEQGRGVQMADAQVAEVRHQRHRVIQGEATMKLQPEGCPWRWGVHLGH